MVITLIQLITPLFALAIIAGAFTLVVKRVHDSNTKAGTIVRRVLKQTFDID